MDKDLLSMDDVLEDYLQRRDLCERRRDNCWRLDQKIRADALTREIARLDGLIQVVKETIADLKL